MIDTLRQRIEDVVEQGTVHLKKWLISELVHEIVVNGRQEVLPTFRVPIDSDQHTTGEQVSRLKGSVGVTGLEPVTSSL